ncbi:molecular chaperone DnaJ [Mesorhizobium loti]|nr:molecular chaperone DnaJ [Mesorhizobium loti]PLP58762.1 molecular chaperone DnaJ [Mesorhizobium loti]
MGIVIVVAAVVLALAGVAALFLRADPRAIAGNVRIALPVGLGTAGIAILAAGRAGFGLLALAAAGSLYLMFRKERPVGTPMTRHSLVRTAALEMELDHDTGRLEGLVLAGLSEGKMLGTMNLTDLGQLYQELAVDPDSRQLLETYLDGRFPTWRLDTQTYRGERLGVAPGAGAMTKEEAYKILGLETGAAATDVRKAHRRLMQRLYPDVGNASFLAARINEAKDVLLSNHH